MNYHALNYSLTCLFDDSEIVDQIISDMGLKPNKIPKLHVSSILANMLLSQCTELPVIHATRCEYKWSERYNPFGLRKRGVSKMLRTMVKSGYIHQYKGFKVGGIGKPSSFEPTDKLRDILGGISDLSKIRFPPEQEMLIKKVDGIKVGYKDTAKTIRMREFLTRYNQMLDRCEVVHQTNIHFIVSQKKLKRNFVDFTNELGGRFYSSYQMIPSRERVNLTIDGEPVVELDFKAMNIAMLWGKQGINVFDHFSDPYALETDIHEDSKVQRRIVKKLFMAMLGSGCTRDAVNSTKMEFRDDFFLEYEVLKSAVAEIRKNHMPIGHHFFKGKTFPLELQFMDSQICESILEVMLERGVLVLPVHDSFIVQAKHESQLLETMRMAFINHCGGFDPVIEKKG